jgi:Fic family protein
LQEKLIVDWTYHSNAIEGNTLTLTETKVVLEHGLTVGKKPLKDHLEAIGHQEAILYLFDVIHRSEAISERLIKDIHAIILRKIEPEIAGRYRSCQVAITGANHQPPDYIHVPDIIRTEDRLDYYQALDVYGTDRNVEPFVSMVVKREQAALEYLIQFLQ